MLRTSKAARMAQGLAGAALIFSLSVTTFAGSANAAPLADCSEAAHARNDATHLLHRAWKVFNGDLKDLASEAKKLNKESRKDKSSTVMTTDARGEVASAKQELKNIRSQAHADIQAEVELGTACNDEEDEDTTTTTTTSTSVTAPSDATAPADSTGSAHTFDTSGLDAKYKDIVEQAIEDMQAVVDEARAAVMDMAAAAETTETNDDAEATTDLKTAKAEREKAKEAREEAKAEAKGKSKDKSEAKSSNSGGKGNGKSKNRK
jgi:hypothetical protein